LILVDLFQPNVAPRDRGDFFWPNL